jgi:hypothetical protein
MANEKNLKPFQKGNPGGPGRPRNPPELMDLSLMTQGEFKLLMHRLINLRPEELSSFKGTILEMAVASIIQRAIKDGDPVRLQYFTDRLFGKVSDKLEISPINLMTPREKLEAAKQAILKLEAKLDSDE